MNRCTDQRRTLCSPFLFPKFAPVHLHMASPIFFVPGIPANGAILDLPEENARHVVQVLRMQAGEALRLSDGRGNMAEAAIVSVGKKQCAVAIQSVQQIPPAKKKISIAISPVKNSSRFEWFLEKATEIGVQEIIPLICQRTEKQHLRIDRLKNILVSAMLQSQQAWLPELLEPRSFSSVIQNHEGYLKLVAHCADDDKRVQLSSIRSDEHTLILIGPEGDFTMEEIQAAMDAGFRPVMLGETRLRTETAAVVAVSLLRNLGSQ